MAEVQFSCRSVGRLSRSSSSKTRFESSLFEGWKRVEFFFFEQQIVEQQQLVEASAAVEGAGDRDGVASGCGGLGDVTVMLPRGLMDRGCCLRTETCGRKNGKQSMRNC